MRIHLRIIAVIMMNATLASQLVAEPVKGFAWTKFKDDFEEPDSSCYNWRYSGSTKCENGVLTLNGNSVSPFLNRRNTIFHMPEMFFRARRASGQGPINVSWNNGYNSETAYKKYLVTLTEDGLQLYKQTGMDTTELVASGICSLANNEWHAFRIEQLPDGTLTVIANGKQVLAWKDPVPFNFDGSIYFESGKDAVIQMDDIVIKERLDQPATTRTATFEDANMPDWLSPHLSEWVINNGCIASTGDMPEAGWYLRTEHKRQIHEVSLRLYKESEGGVCSLLAMGWNLILRDKELMLKLGSANHYPFNDCWTQTLVRKISFPAKTWCQLRITFDLSDNRVLIFWNEKQIAEWKRPSDEWKGFGYDEELACRQLEMGNPSDVLVFHSWNTGIKLDEISIMGVETGNAEFGLENVVYSGSRFEDTNYARIAPDEPVTVLPLTNDVGNNENEALGLSINTRVRLGTSSPFHKTFKVSRQGLYTLKLMINGMKNTAVVMTVRLNGQDISRECYRGLTPRWTLPYIFDYIPLNLSPGEYSLTIKADTIVPNTKGMAGLFFGKIELSEGHAEPSYLLTPTCQPAAAMDADMFDCELFGKMLKFHLTNFAPGSYTVKMTFSEMLLDRPGQRLMDVFINGKLVQKDFDITAEAGGARKPIVKSWPVTVSDSGVQAEIKLVGINFPACVHGIEFQKDGKVVLKYNAGWTDGFTLSSPYWPSCVDSDTKDAYGCFIDPANNPDKSTIFEEHNLIANPRFSLYEEKTDKPKGWRSVAECENNKIALDKIFKGMMPGIADASIDISTFRSEPSSLKITNNRNGAFGLMNCFQWINFHKTQRFSAYVKSKGLDGSVYLEMYWLKSDFMRRQLGFPHYKLIRSDKSQALTGDSDWVELAVDAKPPIGASVGVPVIRVESKGGECWVDDARFDGYGSEPVEILCNHLGYDITDNISVLVRSINNKPLSVSLVNADSGKVETSVDTKGLGKKNFPERYYFEATIPPVKKEGNYFLKAAQEGKDSRSVAFKIESKLYAKLAKQIEKTGIHTQRMNTEIPGVHAVDWLEGSVMPASLGRFDMQYKIDSRIPAKNRMGGWYDASDRARYNNQQIPAIFGLLNQAMLIPDDAPSALDEAAWGLKGFLRAQKNDGTFWQQMVYYLPDTTQNTPSLKGHFQVRASRNATLPQASGVLAMAAYAFRDHRTDLSKRYYDAALLSYNRLVTDWENKCSELSAQSESFKSNLQKRYHRLDFAPKALWAELYMLKLHDSADRRQAFDSHLESLLNALNEKAYLSPEYHKVAVNHDRTILLFDYLWVPMLILKEMPDHPRKEEMKQALKTAFNEMKRLCAQDVFGVLPSMAPGVAPDYPKEKGFLLEHRSVAAYTMALGAQILGDPELRTMASRQMDWLLGRNRHDLSIVSGIGRQFQNYATTLMVKPEYFLDYKKNGNGLINGGMIFAGTCHFINKEVLQYGDGNIAPYVQGWPGGYRYAAPATSYAPTMGEEIWIAVTGDILSAAAALSFGEE